ncbi:thioesterase domain-containing protein [Streptomyces sp. DSM 41527]|uniref:PhpL n=2 Tax=Streptomyces TaxID=1883 RepID=Q03093_STRHY|nr:thioesterase domain-containing protein [Streptomyces sp. DSM 41527]AAA79278.1 thioesterase [Streptomyces hygroscopicus]AKN91129.1 PhpL [Streptomyces hygroscopicus]MDT0457049.1 thioesterase domain-containing protein [Streptomyces sp. DSM 41527]
MTDWIQSVSAPDAVARVVCLSRAGGSARDFDRWRAPMGEDVELAAVQLPGRLDRFHEPPLSDLHEIAEEVAAALTTLPARPYVLFGDCMGALLAFETACALRRRGAAPPDCLVVASYPAPDRLRTERPYGDGSADDLRQRLREVGGVPPAVLDEDELFELMLPMLRADFAAFEGYRHRPTEPLSVDIHALVGADDPYVTVTDLHGWQRHTTGEFTARALPGGHFFLHESDDAVSRVRSLALAGARAARPGRPE